MQCPRCKTLLDDDTVFCGNCGKQIATVQAPGATVAGPMEDMETLRVVPNPVGARQAAQNPPVQRFSPRTPPYVPASDTPAQDKTQLVNRRGGSPLASA